MVCDAIAGGGELYSHLALFRHIVSNPRHNVAIRRHLVRAREREMLQLSHGSRMTLCSWWRIEVVLSRSPRSFEGKSILLGV